MKAARFHGRGDIRVDDVAEPAVRPGTVAVQVEWCGICGTDLHEYLEGPIFVPTPAAPHALIGVSLPLTLGHEFAGVVTEVGTGVDGLAVGDRVAVEPYVVCGRCDACSQGRYNVCASLGFVGLSGGGGGFSRFVVAERRWIHPLGDLGTDVGALIEPLAVAYHAVRLSGARPEHSAVVFREVSVLGSLAHAHDHPATIEMVSGGRVDPYQFITGRIDLDDIVERGFQGLIDNKEDNVKILVRP